MGRSSKISQKNSKETNGVTFVFVMNEKAKSSEREHEAVVKGSKDIQLF